MLKIEPVSQADRARALKALVGADSDANRRAQAFERILDGPKGGRCRLWWARSLRGPRAVAMTMPSPGCCAMLFYSPPGAGRSAVQILAQVIAELTELALADGVAFVQGMALPGDTAAGRAFRGAGYLRLAELVYMRKRLDTLAPSDVALEWRPLRSGDEPTLGKIIAETYTDSQDCPDLLGLREMSDVITSHKASGVFHPESWWLPKLAGETVGCVLVNDAAGRNDTTELVYLGVRPQWRRRGLARAMLRHALADSLRRGRQYMQLAVDLANRPAVELYQQEGFVEIDRRIVHLRAARRD